MPPIRDMGRHGRNQRCRVKDLGGVILGRARSLRPPAAADPGAGHETARRVTGPGPSGPWAPRSTGLFRCPMRTVPRKAPGCPFNSLPAGFRPPGRLTGKPHAPAQTTEGPWGGQSRTSHSRIKVALHPFHRYAPPPNPGRTRKPSRDGGRKGPPYSFNAPNHLESQPWNARSSSSSPMPPSVA